MYQVTEKAQTLSGKWQVRVVIDANQSAFFKFNSEPSQTEIDRQADMFKLQSQLSILSGTTLPEVLPEPTRLTKLAYMNRFTDAELAGIYTAAKQSSAVEVWLERFKLAEFIDLADPQVLSGLQALEQGGLLVVGRAAVIAGV